MSQFTSVTDVSGQQIARIGSGLNRPESVLATRSGNLFSCDWTAGIVKTTADGKSSPAVAHDLIADKFLPNGIALQKDGRFLFANLGEAGGVWQIATTCAPREFLTEVEGRKIPPANFVYVDGARTWITVSASTRAHKYFTAQETSGFIAVVENGQARIVAENLTWTNELRIAPDRRHLYVNETFACKTTRFDLAHNGDLSNRHSFDYPPGTFPDGMAFDVEGALWSVCVVSNRIIRLLPGIGWNIVFEDVLQDTFARVCQAYSANQMTRDMIVESRGKHVANLTSLAFGGSDLRTLYLGSLTNSSILSLRSPVAGLAPEHWEWG